MSAYWRPIPTADPAARDALPLAGGPCRFREVERVERGRASDVVPAREAPGGVLERLTARRESLAGLSLDVPRIMGILNVTPDSFSDGGQFLDGAAAGAQAARMVAEGADLIDVGGESTRPGARDVPADEEASRILPAIRVAAPLAPVSVDTRKAAVAEAALKAGAMIVNDVSALRFDPGMGRVAGGAEGLVLMHSVGTPATMQADPRYDDVLLDVYDALAERIAAAETAGVARDKIVVDPGIGFGKTLQHNVTLLRRIALYHGLGCALLLGASRKGFIGALGRAPDPRDRMPGSLAVALHAAAQGVHVIRVHDVAETRQALALGQVLCGRETREARQA